MVLKNNKIEQNLKEYIPNKETIAAIKEVKKLKEDKKKKSYTSFTELLKDTDLF